MDDPLHIDHRPQPHRARTASGSAAPSWGIWLLLLAVALLCGALAWWWLSSGRDAPAQRPSPVTQTAPAALQPLTPIRQADLMAPAAPTPAPTPGVPATATPDTMAATVVAPLQATPPTVMDAPAATSEAALAPGDTTPKRTVPVRTPWQEADSLLERAMRPWLHERARAWLQADMLRRFVATVDNLPTERAPVAMWPVHPTPGRFTVEESGPDAYQARLQWIGARNHARYEAAVWLAQRMDARQAVQLYVQHYPLMQQAYEELGYPGRSFHTRLLEVIDHLLQTPEPDAPLRVSLMPVHGSVVSLQPWVRYELVEPEMESRSAGQKILLRMGVQHTRTIKQRLRELRPLLQEYQWVQNPAP